jgi:membrane protein YdbS with pleckstrin-like domain
MAYPREMLNEDEEIVFDRHPHWSYMMGSIVMVALGVLAFIVIAIVSLHYAWVGLVIIALMLLGSVGRYLRWQTTEFVLTSSRIVVRQGILSKHGLEIPLDRVMNISYHQTIWERILGTGDLVVESAGEDGRQSFTDVAKPAHVQNLIYKLAERDQRVSNTPIADGLGGGHGRSSHHSGLSVPEQIEKLAELRANGSLSEEEFQRAKRELLEDM